MFSKIFNNKLCSIKRWTLNNVYFDFGDGYGYEFLYGYGYGYIGFEYDYFNLPDGDWITLYSNLNCHLEPYNDAVENITPNSFVIGLSYLYFDNEQDITEKDLVEIDAKEYEVQSVLIFSDKRLGFTKCLIKDTNKSNV